MGDIWKELGTAIGRALKPLATLGSAIWKGFGDATSDLVKGFLAAAKGLGKDVGPVIEDLMPDLFRQATAALGEESPPEEIRKAVDEMVEQLMAMVEREGETEHESVPTMEELKKRGATLVGGVVTLYAVTHAVSMALDASHPFKEWGFKAAVMDTLFQFDMGKVVGPMIQSSLWSSLVTPLRMRANEKYPYVVPGMGVLPYLRFKGIITEEQFQQNMRYHALDKSWAAAMLENTARYPSFSELRTMIHRGAGTWEEAKVALQRSLTHSEYLDDYEALVPSIPGVSDLVRFAVREAYPDAKTFEQHFAKMTSWIGRIGFDEYFAEAFWTAHWIIPSPGQADDMLHRGIITEAEHTALYILNDIRPEDIANLRKLTWNLPGRIDSRWLFRWGEISVTDLRDLLVKGGLDPEYADQVAAATARNQFMSLINREVTNVKADFIRGYSVESTLREDLGALGIPPAFVDYHVADALADRERSMQDERLRTLRTQYARRAISMADVIADVETIIVDDEARAAWLEALPTAKSVMVVEETYTTEVNRLVANAKYDYVRGYILREELVRRLKLLDLPDEVIEFHIVDADEDRERKRNDERLVVIKDMWMKDVETDFDVITGWVDPILVDVDARELWLADTYFDRMKAPLRPPTPPRLPAVTLATMTRAFREGIIDEADLREELTNRGYSVSDIDIMVAVERARMV